MLLEGLSHGEFALVIDVLGRHERHTGCPDTRRVRARLEAAGAAPVRVSVIAGALAEIALARGELAPPQGGEAAPRALSPGSRSRQPHA